MRLKSRVPGPASLSKLSPRMKQDWPRSPGPALGPVLEVTVGDVAGGQASTGKAWLRDYKRRTGFPEVLCARSVWFDLQPDELHAEAFAQCAAALLVDGGIRAWLRGCRFAVRRFLPRRAWAVPACENSRFRRGPELGQFDRYHVSQTFGMRDVAELRCVALTPAVQPWSYPQRRDRNRCGRR